MMVQDDLDEEARRTHVLDELLERANGQHCDKQNTPEAMEISRCAWLLHPGLPHEEVQQTTFPRACQELTARVEAVASRKAWQRATRRPEVVHA
jgi:hypothetical protein